jgi:hypothetical protein
MGGALERARLLAEERPRDHPRDIQRLQQGLRRCAHPVKPLQPEMRLMRRDLKDRIRRGVADRLQAPDMLFAILLDDLGARGMAVPQDAGKIAVGDQARDEIFREAGQGLRKIAPVERHRAAGDLPMPARRILAHGNFRGAAIGAGKPVARQSLRHAPGADLRGFAQTEPREIGQLQAALARSGQVRLPRGAGLGNMPQGIRPLIAEPRRIRGGAKAEGIHHQNDRPSRHSSSLTRSRCRILDHNRRRLHDGPSP